MEARNRLRCPIHVSPVPSMPRRQGLLRGRRGRCSRLHSRGSTRRQFASTATPTARRPVRGGRLGRLGLLAKHERLEALETQLRFPQRKEQPKIKREYLHQEL